jgi:hypothetical protein
LEIRQSFTVPFAADQVWRCFHDIEAIVGCLPGAGLAEPPREGQLALSMMAEKMTAQFSGNLRKKLDADQFEPALAPTPAAPLDLGKMFWSVLIARLKRWFGLSAKRLDDVRSQDD